jgi:hypothetical protein
VRRLLPHLSYHFHLTPDDVWNMGQADLAVYVDALEELQREAN